MSLKDIPDYAKGDYVLERIKGEARQTRRNWLADQVLAPNEPRTPITKFPAWQEAIRAPFRRMLGPIDERLNFGLTRIWFKGKRIFLFLLLPLYATHYVTKYHIANKPGAIVMSRPQVYPGDPDPAPDQ
ncbi:NADH dehydrogenase [ubiquinone] 1 beta subcomplex subunit 6-like [Ptychodera flava]|uniref:NADH dehydrogenase [ubiquinone] 1 beta subcomplex subunit 6-like n=1 Tax=Ptychodera flava TaxID=63121 RepID=UPI00396A15EE